MSAEKIKIKICVAGGSGFIGSHLAKRLKKDGFYVVCADWKRNEFMSTDEFCDEFLLVDLRKLENCIRATKGCRDVYNLAADMGGCGFISSNHSVLFYNNLQISSNMMEASRQNEIKRFFYSSSACVYNEDLQAEADILPLKEQDAWPARPQDAYGLEKLCTEELCMHYGKDFGLHVRIARFHNIYGPRGTWKGGREKVPAAFCRKAHVSTEDFEVWGDGTAVRSFCYIDDCIEGILKIMNSGYTKPLNLGSDEAVSMNGLAKMVLTIVNKDIPLRHIPGPEGVKGRNSDNSLIKKVLGWGPSISLKDGMVKTLAWVENELSKLDEKSKKSFVSSEIVKTEDALKYTGDL